MKLGTWEEAEAIKIFYNTFISTKLALVNMIADVAEGVGNMNVDVVTDALKRFNDENHGPTLYGVPALVTVVRVTQEIISH